MVICVPALVHMEALALIEISLLIRHLPPKDKASVELDKDKDQAKSNADLLRQVLKNPDLSKIEDNVPDDGEHSTENSNQGHNEDIDDSGNDPLKNTEDDDDLDDPNASTENSENNPNSEAQEQHHKHSDDQGDNNTEEEADGPVTRGTQIMQVGSPQLTQQELQSLASVPSTLITPSTNDTVTGHTANITANTAPKTTTLKLMSKVRALRKPLSDTADTHNPDSITPGATTTNGTTPSCNDHNAGSPPLGTTSPDSCLNQTKTNKRKPNSEESNSIRNICMCSWNERQPNGQGPLSEFDTYFKSLTDTQKELFKKEQRIAQATTRKAKASAKKANNVPNAN
ncbi:hypothetical protein BJY52DRAFT_1220125 [Lactarius psammicola]|nr:hypothetical protein BJY52DRAFT_1220125 [Lactarius psammicola]